MKYFLLIFLLAAQAQAQQLYTSPCVQSGDYVKCLPTVGMFLNDQRGLFLGNDTDDNHYVELRAPAGLATHYSLIYPETQGGDGQVLYKFSGAQLGWTTPFSQAAFDQYEQTLPMKVSVQTASTGNIDMSLGNPGVVDGFDCTFACTLLLKDQTDNTQNGVWRVDLSGVWSRDPTMPDNGNSAFSAIVAVNDGPIVNGNTIWFARANGLNVPFVQIPSYYNTDDATLVSVVFKGNGAGAANSSAITVRVTRVGRQVSLYIPAVTDAATGTTSTHLDSQTNLPTFARPSTTVSCYTGARNNGALVANSVSEVDVLSTGQIQVQRDTTGTAYTNSANAGFTRLSCSYPIF